MDAKLLKKLDENISKIVEVKKGELGFYYDHIEFIMDLGMPLFRIKQSINLEDYKQEFSQDFDYYTVERLLTKISPEVLKKYYELDSTGRLKRIRETDEDLGDECKFNREKGLILVLSNKYDYKCSLAHELMHATNMDNDEDYLTPAILTEFISIFIETYANDILPSLGFKEDEIDYMIRFKMSRDIEIKQILIPFIIKSKYGEINEENLLKLHEEKHYFDNIEDYNLEEMANVINIQMMNFEIFGKPHQERKYFMHILGMCLLSLKYDLSTCLAFYAREHLSVEQVLEINERLIMCPYLKVFTLLESYGIKLDDEFKEESLAAVSKYVEEHKKKKTYN